MEKLSDLSQNEIHHLRGMFQAAGFNGEPQEIISEWEAWDWTLLDLIMELF